MDALLDVVLGRYGRVDVLINNAANNPKMEAGAEVEFSRLKSFTLEQWEADVAVGLTAHFFVVGLSAGKWRGGVAA